MRDLGVLWYPLRHMPSGTITDPETGRKVGVGKRPFASTPPSCSAWVRAMVEDDPSLTVGGLRELVLHDDELSAVLGRYVSDGFGHLRAGDCFA